MTDAGQPILIDIQSTEINCFEGTNGSFRYALGYVSGEFSKLLTSADLMLVVHYKRGIKLNWEKIKFKLKNNSKLFRQKLPLGLTVVGFYVQITGYIAPDTGDPNFNTNFELTDFEISVKEIPIGKFAGEPLEIIEEIPQSEPIVPFEMQLDMIGEVQATQSRAVWWTSHLATTKIIYGTSLSEMVNVIEDLTFIQFHDKIISGLSADTTYYAQFYSTSKITGQTISSNIKSFKTS